MSNRRRVFVVQNSLTMRDGVLVSKFDLSPAHKWGELVELVGPSARPFPDCRPIVKEMRAKLSGYDPDRDYLLLVGSPVLIGVATKLAAENHTGRVSLLQWDGVRRSYFCVQVELSA